MAGQGLWQHQREAIMYARGRREVILNVGMGAGKTRTAIEILKEFLLGLVSPRVIVCCPKAVIDAWAKQMGLWWPEVRVLCLDKGSSAEKEDRVRAALADLSPLIVVVNYETAWRMPITEKTRWTAIVYDEVHRLKAPSGAQGRWAARMGQKNPEAKRLGLSGTLIAHSPLDAWGVYRAMESPELTTFPRTYTAFKARYCVTNPRVPGMVLRFVNQEEMQRKIANTTFFRRTEDCIDLPPISHDELEFSLSAHEARVYRELEREFCALLGDKTVTPQNAMVGALRLLQCCGGFVTADGEKAATTIDPEGSSKARRLAEWLEDLDAREPLVIFCRFRADIDSARAVVESSGRTVSELSGRMNDLARWQAGSADALVAQIQSGGIGIDLTRASLGVFYSIGYSLAEYLQAVARLHRPGQSKHTHFYSLVAMQPNKSPSIESRVYEALRERKDVVDELVSLYRADRGRGHVVTAEGGRRD